MGRTPLPTAVKAAKGTLKPERLNGTEPEYPLGLPQCPPWLKGKIARTEWMGTGALLVKSKVLTQADWATFAVYCHAVSEFAAMTRKIAKEGAVIEGEKGPVKNPAVSVRDSAWARMAKAGSELGLTPASRTRVVGSRAKDEGENSVAELGDAPTGALKIKA